MSLKPWKCVRCFGPVGERDGKTLDCPECGGCLKCCACPSKLGLTYEEAKTIWTSTGPLFSNTMGKPILPPRVVDPDMGGNIFVTDGELTMPLPKALVEALGAPPGMTVVPSPEPDTEPPDDLFMDEEGLRFHVYQILGIETKPRPG